MSRETVKSLFDNLDRQSRKFASIERSSFSLVSNSDWTSSQMECALRYQALIHSAGSLQGENGVAESSS